TRFSRDWSSDVCSSDLDDRRPLHERGARAPPPGALVTDLPRVHRARVAVPARAAGAMRVLVTGASGFVGYAVAAALTERGHTVVGLTRSTTSALPEGVRRAHGDLSPDCLRDALADVDGVCHLAARTRARDSRADPLGYW